MAKQTQKEESILQMIDVLESRKRSVEADLELWQGMLALERGTYVPKSGTLTKEHLFDLTSPKL